MIIFAIKLGLWGWKTELLIKYERICWYPVHLIHDLDHKHETCSTPPPPPLPSDLLQCAINAETIKMTKRWQFQTGDIFNIYPQSYSSYYHVWYIKVCWICSCIDNRCLCSIMDGVWLLHVVLFVLYRVGHKKVAHETLKLTYNEYKHLHVFY